MSNTSTGVRVSDVWIIAVLLGCILCLLVFLKRRGFSMCCCSCPCLAAEDEDDNDVHSREDAERRRRREANNNSSSNNNNSNTQGGERGYGNALWTPTTQRLGARPHSGERTGRQRNSGPNGMQRGSSNNEQPHRNSGMNNDNHYNHNNIIRHGHDDSDDEGELTESQVYAYLFPQALPLSNDYYYQGTASSSSPPAITGMVLANGTQHDAGLPLSLVERMGLAAMRYADTNNIDLTPIHRVLSGSLLSTGGVLVPGSESVNSSMENVMSPSVREYGRAVYAPRRNPLQACGPSAGPSAAFPDYKDAHSSGDSSSSSTSMVTLAEESITGSQFSKHTCPFAHSSGAASPTMDVMQQYGSPKKQSGPLADDTGKGAPQGDKNKNNKNNYSGSTISISVRLDDGVTSTSSPQLLEYNHSTDDRNTNHNNTSGETSMTPRRNESVVFMQSIGDDDTPTHNR